MESIVKVCFELLGTKISPKEISQKTGISPSTELMRGERNKLRDLPRQNIWSLDSSLQSDEVSEHWQELEGVLNPSRQTIKEIAKDGTAKITIVITSDHRLPSITIPSSMAEFAGFVNSVIDIDHLQQ
ncbi:MULTISPECIES: DUF4279 domain-containing protein [unclassified Janthinobacterium]|uniref:DUF4279 domain-containing protein n=1 Tax=unclassified Janthinobacterium TaxID=2610881 RepID=UPI001BFDEDAD|nr:MULTISPECIES: DUF4279 domain-containing protein [unclassified Janthinobacterium]MED5596114.1 DUF4279 domain-containing protein [Janthinobacterium sp. P210006]